MFVEPEEHRFLLVTKRSKISVYKFLIFLASAIENRKTYNAVITAPYILTASYWNVMYITC